MINRYSNEGQPKKRGRNTGVIILAALIVLGLLLLVLGVRIMSGEDMMNSSRWGNRPPSSLGLGLHWFLANLCKENKYKHEYSLRRLPKV